MQITKAVKQIANRYRLVITASPIQNHPKELWALLQFATNSSLDRLYPHYSEAFLDKPSDRQKRLSHSEQAKKNRALRIFHSQIRPYILRRTKSEIMGLASIEAQEASTEAILSSGTTSGNGVGARQETMITGPSKQNMHASNASGSLSIGQKKELLIWCPLAPVQQGLYIGALLARKDQRENDGLFGEKGVEEIVEVAAEVLPVEEVIDEADDRSDSSKARDEEDIEEGGRQMDSTFRTTMEPIMALNNVSHPNSGEPVDASQLTKALPDDHGKRRNHGNNSLSTFRDILELRLLSSHPLLLPEKTTRKAISCFQSLSPMASDSTMFHDSIRDVCDTAEWDDASHPLDNEQLRHTVVHEVGRYHDEQVQWTNMKRLLSKASQGAPIQGRAHTDERDSTASAQTIINALVAASGKCQALVCLLTELLLSRKKTLIFCQFQSTLNIVEYILRHFHLLSNSYCSDFVGSQFLSPNATGVTYIRMDGRTKPQDRRDVCRQFNADPELFACLLTTGVGAHGLTLTGAEAVVIFDPHWNPSVDTQAVDRAYRIGQNKDVCTYRLITVGTVEERMYRQQVYKLSLVQYALEEEGEEKAEASNDTASLAKNDYPNNGAVMSYGALDLRSQEKGSTMWPRSTASTREMHQQMSREEMIAILKLGNTRSCATVALLHQGDETVIRPKEFDAKYFPTQSFFEHYKSLGKYLPALHTNPSPAHYQGKFLCIGHHDRLYLATMPPIEPFNPSVASSNTENAANAVVPGGYGSRHERRQKGKKNADVLLADGERQYSRRKPRKQRGETFQGLTLPFGLVTSNEETDTAGGHLDHTDEVHLKLSASESEVAESLQESDQVDNNACAEAVQEPAGEVAEKAVVEEMSGSDVAVHNADSSQTDASTSGSPLSPLLDANRMRKRGFAYLSSPPLPQFPVPPDVGVEGSSRTPEISLISYNEVGERCAVKTTTQHPSSVSGSRSVQLLKEIRSPEVFEVITDIIAQEEMTPLGCLNWSNGSIINTSSPHSARPMSSDASFRGIYSPHICQDEQYRWEIYDDIEEKEVVNPKGELDKIVAYKDFASTEPTGSPHTAAVLHKIDHKTNLPTIASTKDFTTLEELFEHVSSTLRQHVNGCPQYLLLLSAHLLSQVREFKKMMHQNKSDSHVITTPKEDKNMNRRASIYDIDSLYISDTEEEAEMESECTKTCKQFVGLGSWDPEPLIHFCMMHGAKRIGYLN